MKLLIITDAWHPQVNGVVRTYEHLMPEITKLGHEIKILGPTDFPLRVPMPGYSEIELTLFPYKRLRGAIRTFTPDAIHIATEGPLGLAAKRYCIDHNLPFNTAYHTQFPDYVAKRIKKIAGPRGHDAVKKNMIEWIKKFHSESGAVFVTTKSMEDELKSWDFPSPTHIMTRGVTTDVFTPEGEKALSHLKGPVALYVGRVAIEKNIEAFLDMPWHGSKAVVGDGPSLQRLCARYPEVHFSGKKTGHDLAAHYRGADLFVFPSRTDTFGMVITEALACGLPVAAYNVAGPKDIVTESFLGTLHDNDLATAAHAALAAPGSRNDRFAHIKDNYAWPEVARRFLEINEMTRIKPKC